MVTKQILHAEVDSLPDADLDAVYAFILQVKQTKAPSAVSLLQKLKQIQITAPVDFSANHDVYGSGAERGDSDIR
jgi:hypothetical protein